MFLRMPSNYKGIWKGSQIVQVEAHECIHILFSMLNLLSFVYKKRFLKIGIYLILIFMIQKALSGNITCFCNLKYVLNILFYPV